MTPQEIPGLYGKTTTSGLPLQLGPGGMAMPTNHPAGRVIKEGICRFEYNGQVVEVYVPEGNYEVIVKPGSKDVYSPFGEIKRLAILDILGKSI